MKVLLVNGSPKPAGCTYTALREVADALEKNGIETEIIHVGTDAVRGCMGCGGCAKNDNQCVFGGTVNEVIQKAKTADGFVFGTPVHYASASGAITSFLDRAFYAGGKFFAFKPGAAVASCRRGGASASLDQINKYFGITNMPIVGSNYWNMVHGNTPEQVRQDEEGMQTMRILGNNMAWLLRCIQAGKEAGVPEPAKEEKIRTNYIR